MNFQTAPDRAPCDRPGSSIPNTLATFVRSAAAMCIEYPARLLLSQPRRSTSWAGVMVSRPRTPFHSAMARRVWTGRAASPAWTSLRGMGMGALGTGGSQLKGGARSAKTLVISVARPRPGSPIRVDLLEARSFITVIVFGIATPSHALQKHKRRRVAASQITREELARRPDAAAFMLGNS